MSGSVDKIDEELEGKDEKALRKMLHNLSSEVDQEGLIFLINQTRVLIYNRKVEKANRKILEAQVEVTEKKMKKPQRPAAAREVEIVERGEGKHFFIVVNNFRIYFTLDEMRHLVKICHAADDEVDASQRLYNWFKRIRSDFLVDGGIGSPRNPYLADLYRKLISTYRPREDA